jgi:hypothetical protein
MKYLFIIIFIFFNSTFSYAEELISGKWRGVVLGHVDNRDYFINATVKQLKSDTFEIQLKLFSGDYAGEFLLHTTLKNGNKLYINRFKSVSEYPYVYPYVSTCFSGYFQLNQKNGKELDLYRNPIYRKTEDFTKTDATGNYIPEFECFTSVLLKPVNTDTAFSKLEKLTDSIIAVKKSKTQELSKRKVVGVKEHTATSEKLVLQIWDNNKEDGDIISLKLNDTWILTNFLLKKEKHTIEIELKKKDNQLLLFAENLGSIPPNTAAISIHDGSTEKTYILNSDLNKSETIKMLLVK